MKGFLHRVASGVVQPRVTLHPLAQSIFSASAGSALTPLDASQDTTSFVRPTIQPSPAHRDAEASTTQSLAPRVVDSREQFQPVVQPRQQSPSTLEASFERRAEIEALSAIHDESLQAKFRKSQDAASGDGELDDPSSTAGFIPIMLGKHAGMALGEQEQTLSSITPNNVYANAAKVELARRSVRQQSSQPAPTVHSSPSQSDDIQIHIGRIEVVAVPQQAPRPAAPATRKGISLDEYLSRRNGRTN
jgi:hypothetical protein